MTAKRTKDIKRLCKAILELRVNRYEDTNGGYESSCPFCSAEEHRRCDSNDMWAKIEDLNHEQNCSYLVAKDLYKNM